MIDLTVVLTTSADGSLAYRSARSVRRAAEYAAFKGIQTEVLAVVDRLPSEMRAYYAAHKNLFDRVEYVDLRDHGLARNQGATSARGRYVAFLEGDNLFGEGWLAAAYEYAERQQTGAPLILHPEANIVFGDGLLLFGHVETASPAYSALASLESDRWTSLAFVEREFFLACNLYSPSDFECGFGNEVWRWNCEVMARGAQHRVVPSTVHFLRGQHKVPWRRASHSDCILPPTELFRDISSSFEDVCSPADGSPQSSGSLIDLGKRWVVGRLESRPKLSRFGSDVSRAVARLVSAPPPPAEPLPEWLLAECKGISEVEPELFPTRAAIEGLVRLSPPDVTAGRYYPHLDAAVGANPTHIFLLPWLKRGGADLVATQFISAVVSEAPNSRVVCVTTENADSPWISRLPESVRVVEFGKLYAALPEHDSLNLLRWVLTQKRPGVIHNINSRLGYEVFCRDGASLSKRSRLFVSIFAEEFTSEGSPCGYLFSHLPRCINYVQEVFTDNARVIDRINDLYAFDRSNFSVMYAPAPCAAVQRRSVASARQLNILWASRLDREKRPDVLLRIASELIGEPVHFHVYGAPCLDDYGRDLMPELRRLPNVTMYGSYDGFRSIPTAEYDAFLYTSERDGLPNVLLEAVCAGLPIIAPNVGGISELVTAATGFLVTRADAVDECVRCIRQIRDDPQAAAAKAEAAAKLVATRHSWKAFVSSLHSVDGYLFETNDEPTAEPTLNGVAL